MKTTFFLGLKYMEITLSNFFLWVKGVPLHHSLQLIGSQEDKIVRTIDSHQDIEDVVRIHALCFPEEKDSKLLLYLKKTPNLTYVVMIDNTIVGYATYRISYGMSVKRLISKNVWLYSIGIDPSYQNMGIAKLLLSLTIADLQKTKQPDQFVLLVDNKNHAKLLYEKMGFMKIFQFSHKKRSLMALTIKS